MTTNTKAKSICRYIRGLSITMAVNDTRQAHQLHLDSITAIRMIGGGQR